MPSRTFILFFVLALVSCNDRQPASPENICAIFSEKQNWHDAVVGTEEKWGIPVYVTMAIMYQESAFKFNAKPPMTYALGFIPSGRVSSAYGFSQAKVNTWLDYVNETGNSFSSRDDFQDAVDFMGWYLNKTAIRNKILKNDAYNQYLNYHEGWTGFKNKSHSKKKWLLKVAKKVENRSESYKTQYKACKKDLESDSFWDLFT